jgi:hypothetical protein
MPDQNPPDRPVTPDPDAWFVSPSHFAETYSVRVDLSPYGYTCQYHRTVTYAAAHPDEGALVARAVGAPRGRGDGGLPAGNVPNPIRGLRTAHTYDWLQPDADDPTNVAFATVAPGPLAAGRSPRLTTSPLFRSLARPLDRLSLGDARRAGRRPDDRRRSRPPGRRVGSQHRPDPPVPGTGGTRRPGRRAHRDGLTGHEGIQDGPPRRRRGPRSDDPRDDRQRRTQAPPDIARGTRTRSSSGSPRSSTARWRRPTAACTSRGGRPSRSSRGGGRPESGIFTR